MIDPRFANAGGVPLVPGYGPQQVPVQYQQHHHRHHRHHKHKARNDESPISVDESIHKVDHNQHYHHHHQNDGAPLNSGYGVPYGAGGYENSVPYGAAGFGVGAPTGFYPQQQQQQQQQFGGANFGYANQYQGVPYNQGVPYTQGQFVGGPAGSTVKHHRRHHRHHRHQNGEAANNVTGADQAQAVPEQLIGQRSSSVLGNEQQQQQTGSPLPPVEGDAGGEQVTQHRHHRRHHHHHHSGEHAGLGHTHQSRQTHGHTHTHTHTSAGADGYGHINDDLIFIERGDHSPHRQEPPQGYEYKGKIEVQGIDKEYHTQSQVQGSALPVHQPVAPPPSLGPCPPGWQQMALSGGSCGPCPSGGLSYTGQLIGSGGVGGLGGLSGLSGLGGLCGGFGNFGAGFALPANCQIVGDYNFGSTTGGVISSGGNTFTEQVQNQQVQEHVSGRATIIEVWQKRSKSETRERSRSRSQQRTRTPVEGPSFDFERFRSEILAAVERAVSRGGPAPEIQWTGRDGGTQTQIHPSTGETHPQPERRQESSGEVRVIVQPIQPVFYMPRQTATPTAPQIGPAPVVQQQAASAAPHIVYVPRNVYVPVIKPVFVPRERVIIRPQVIHVARPVLVDRPVPVTQRPIIIDRERPIPVPVRGGEAVAQGGGSKIVREEYVYRDNLPVAYGGRCAEFAGGVNYGYMPTQAEHQYANSSTHETSSIYQTQGQDINVNVPNQYQQSQSVSHVEVKQGGCGGGGGYGGSYSNLGEVYNAGGAVNVGQLNQQVLQQTFEQSAQVAGGGVYGPNQIEILDTAVNPNWQKADQTALMRRYGRSAADIVHKSKEVEQQMYNELRQRTSSGGVVRSSSTASYGSGCGGAVGNAGFAQY